MLEEKKLYNLLSSLSKVSIRGNSDIPVLSIAYDSHEVKKRCLFFALKGVHTDGHCYIEAAIQAGAVAIVHSEPLPDYRKNITYVQVANTRVALSPVAAEFENHPSREMAVVGVTGTDGKSTTVSFIRQLLEATGARAGSLSTVEFCIGNKHRSNTLRQSTPEANHIHRFLRNMKEEGQDYAILEATSHGLSPLNSRLADVEFRAGVFTNVTSEHLEFHGNLETYRADKARLFQAIAKSPQHDAFGVVNADDPHAQLFIEATGKKPVITYSLHRSDASVFASNFYSTPSGTSFTLSTGQKKTEARIGLPGLFNLENTLAALCTTARLQGLSPLELASICSSLTGIKGRMETIAGDMPFHLMVDYAHSPGSFQKLLPFLKSLTKGRLILVFGSAGERDIEKRPEQGRIASHYADILVLTDEDPRGEDSMRILKDIAKGILHLQEGEAVFCIPDRREAIQVAIGMAQPGDLIATLGKGHEKSIMYAHESVPWDEAMVCRDILMELGYNISH